jgi:hypothetical protein
MTDSAGFGRLTRRGFGKVALAVIAGGIALIRGRSARAWTLPGSRTVYVFDPAAELAIAGPGCATCAACRRHAEHKFFASREAAETRRAHPHCRCAIRAVSVRPTDFVRMFGEPKSPAFRAEFDARWSESGTQLGSRR